MKTVSGSYMMFIFFFQAEDGIRDESVTGVQTCALPISSRIQGEVCPSPATGETQGWRSEEHTSELQSHSHLVCRLLLEKNNTTYQDGAQARQTTDDTFTRRRHSRH